MKFITFKIHNKMVAIPVGKYLLEPTQINKIKPAKTVGLKVGEINYRGQNVDVVDISKLLKKRNLKKFDGLLFVHKEDSDFAIKFEGFFKVKPELEDEEVLIEIDKIMT